MLSALGRNLLLNQQGTATWLRCSHKLIATKYIRRNTSSASQNDDEDGSETKLARFNPKSKLVDAFPNYFHDGEIVNRAKYTEFVYDALKRLEDLGLEKDLEIYKELLKVFPTDLYHPKSKFSTVTIFSMAQQLCVTRLLFEMERHQVFPDKEVEKLILDRFGPFSDVWLKIARMNYWSMKLRNTNPFPIPESAPDNPIELTKLALARICVDRKTILNIWDTSKVITSVDKTWVVSAQSDVQREIIENLKDDDILYIEEGGRAYIREKAIIYYVIKKYHDKPKVNKGYEEKEHDYQSIPMQFYGKPIKEKLEDIKDVHNVDDGYILAIGVTGTSSHDSLLSWLKLMQEKNERLKEISVVFRIDRPTKELVDVSSEQAETKEFASG